jgi:HK97 family phage major capsid protein
MKFKNMQDYLNQRNALIQDAENLINEGKDAIEVMDNIKKLDNAYEDFRTKNANLNALKNNPVVDPAAPVTAGSVNTSGNTEEIKDLSSDEYKRAWIHVMKGNKLTTQEQSIFDSVNMANPMKNTETVSEHSVLIPTTVQHGIWEQAAKEHPVLKDLLPTHVQGDIEIIIDTSSESDADWIDEGDKPADAEFSEGKIVLQGCELAKSVTISWKLKKMNDQDYEAYLIKKLGEKVGNAIAKSIFHGKGKPTASEHKAQAKGFITALEKENSTPNIIKYKETAGVSYKNITSLMSLIPGAYLSGASIYTKGTTLWNQLANILDANKRPIFIPDVTENSVGKIFGIPVKVEDGVEDGEVALANLNKGYAFNFNEEMTIYTEDHVKDRTTDYMAYGIADGDVITTEAFAVMQKEAE